MTKDIQVYLDDILESVEMIKEYTSGMEFADFEQDIQAQDAVMRRLAIVGEAVKNIPDEIRDKYPSIPWRQIAGMRDILIHEYSGVRLERIWKVIESDLDELKANVERIKRDQ